MDDEKYNELVRKFGRTLADELWVNRDKVFSRDARSARMVEQALATCAARHQPEVWKTCVTKGVPTALGTIAKYKAMDATELGTALERVQIAFDSGDRAAIAAALQDLVQLCEMRVAPTGTAASRRTDETARPPVTGKAAKANAFWDGVSQHLAKTGGNSQ